MVPEDDSIASSKSSDSDSQARKRLKALVLGALATSGSLGIIGWHAQAHGNRSSHLTAEVRWEVDRFIFERENVLAPDSETTIALSNIVNSLDALALRREGLSLTLQDEDISPSDASRSLRLLGQDLQEEARLRLERALIERFMLFRPLTTRVLELLSNNDAAGAIQAIEGLGEPRDVLEGYIYTQLDLHNASFVDGQSTPAYIEPIRVISEAGIAYAQALQQTDENRLALAGLLNNYASMMAPDSGSVRDEYQGAGRAAAIQALELRVALDEPVAIMRARWMVALHAFIAEDYQAARDAFTQAASEAETLQIAVDEAWGKAYLGLTLLRLGEDREAAVNLLNEARMILELANARSSLDSLTRVVQTEAGMTLDFR